jgi:hypothetical protein
MSAPEQPEMLTVSQLKASGWTTAMIRDYLGEPDELATNARYKSAAPMRLYRAAE